MLDFGGLGSVPGGTVGPLGAISSPAGRGGLTPFTGGNYTPFAPTFNPNTGTTSDPSQLTRFQGSFNDKFGVVPSQSVANIPPPVSEDPVIDYTAYYRGVFDPQPVQPRFAGRPFGQARAATFGEIQDQAPGSYIDQGYLYVPVGSQPSNFTDWFSGGAYEDWSAPGSEVNWEGVQGFAQGGLAQAIPQGPPQAAQGPVDPMMGMGGAGPQDAQLISAALEAIDPASPMAPDDREMILQMFEETFGEGAVEELQRQFEEAQEVPIDNVPAMLTEGEVVIPRDAVKAADPTGQDNVEAGAGQLMSMVDELRNLRGGSAATPPAGNAQGIMAALQR